MRESKVIKVKKKLKNDECDSNVQIKQRRERSQVGNISVYRAAYEEMCLG